MKKIDENAIQEVTRLAKDAAKNDNWMTVELEDHLDDGDITQAHREGWEETEHWRVYYRTPIQEISDRLQRKYYGDIDPDDYDPIERLHDFTYPLIDLFWDVWEAEQNFDEQLERLLAEHAK